MIIKIQKFNEFSVEELYEVLQLRSEVFVVEQDCVYQDLDGKDQKALHVLGYADDRLVAYTRLFKRGIYFEEASLGRVVVGKENRKYGYGHEIIKASIKALKEVYDEDVIKISAQKYLISFYESHGFKTVGEEYLEDGIPHIAMLKS